MNRRNTHSNMEATFTFGIITDGTVDSRINTIIDSIEANAIPTYEIIVVGNSGVQRRRTRVIPFDETQRRGCWITRKKNVIIEQAQYEHVVFLHDYICLDREWYAGFVRFLSESGDITPSGGVYDWCVSPIENMDGSRYRDYTLFPHKYNRDYDFYIGNAGEIDPYFEHHCLLPYTFANTPEMNRYMYISGSYFIMRRDVARENPLDETLLAFQGEDAELSSRLHQKGILIKCNPYSTVRFLKQKDPVYWEGPIDAEHLERLRERFPV